MQPAPTVYSQGLGAVGADGLNTFTQTVLSVAQLRTLTGLSNMTVLLLGSVNPGDGGQGLFYWSASATGPDNGSTVIQPQSGQPGAWLLLPLNGILGGSTITNALTAPIALNNTSTYFDGPTVVQGTMGTWLVTACVTLVDSAGAALFGAKLWDGTNVIATGATTSQAAAEAVQITLSGSITNPAGNLRMSIRDTTTTSGSMLSQAAGVPNTASVITAVRTA